MSRLAAELARAEGIPVEVVTVADDVSLPGHVERNLGARAVGVRDGGAVAVACWPRALQPLIAGG